MKRGKILLWIFVMVVLCCNVIAAHNLSNNLVVYHSFDLNANPDKGTTNMTVSGTDHTTNGIINGAYDFDQADATANYLRNDAEWTAAGQSFTYSFYFKPNVTLDTNTVHASSFFQQAGTYISVHYRNTGQSATDFLCPSGTFGVRFYNDDTTHKFCTTTTFDAFTTYRITITYDSGTGAMVLWKNATYVGNSTAVISYTIGASPIEVGSDGTTNWDIDGVFDELAVWNISLNTSQVLQMQNCTYGEVCWDSEPAPPVPIGDNTSYYKLNSDYNDSIRDNDGVAVGSPTFEPGIVNYSVVFDGANDYVNMTNVLDMGTDDFSISLWLRPNETAQNGLLSKFVGGGTVTGYYLRTNTNGTLNFVMLSGASIVINLNSNTVLNNHQWYHVVVSVNKSRDVTMYINGTEDIFKNISSVADLDNVGDFVIGKATVTDGLFNGSVDEVYIKKGAYFNDTAVTVMYNRGFGLTYPFTPGDSLNVSDESFPDDASQYNVYPAGYLNITTQVNNSYTADCDLYINDTLNQSKVISQGDKTAWFQVNYAENVEESFEYFIRCQDNFNDFNTTAKQYYIDNVNPQIVFNFPLADNSTIMTTNMTLDIDINDAYPFFATVNVTDPNGSTHFYQEYNLTAATNNISSNYNQTVDGIYTMFVTAADGHTKQLIETFDNEIVDKELEFNDVNKIKIYPVDKTKYDKVTNVKTFDRYLFGFERSFSSLLIEKSKDYYDEFYVESEVGDEIVIIEGSRYPGHIIIKDGTDITKWKWVDFDTPEKYKVEVVKEKRNKVKVKVYGDPGKDYEFNSLGILNTVNQTITYQFLPGEYTITETFDPGVLYKYNTILLLNVSFNPGKYNWSDNAYLDYNGTNYSVSSINISGKPIFNQTVVLPISGPSTNLTHKWYVNLSYVNSSWIIVETLPQNQTIYDVNVSDVCAGPNVYPILNFSYYDQVTGSNINVSNGYDVTFYDGNFYYNLTDSFAGVENEICTNLPPSLYDYFWDMTGTVTLSKDSYASRIITYTAADPLTVGNTDPVKEELYLVPLANSSTITFTWLTTNYQEFVGTMRAYRCELDGSKTLIESVPIAGGQAIMNLRLLVESYSYDVIVDGIVYEDESWTTCHTEAAITRNYFLELVEQDITPAIGLMLVDCRLTDISTKKEQKLDGFNRVRMSWSANPNAQSTLTGCLVAYRQAIYGPVEIYRNCTNSTTYSLERRIPVNTNDYYVRGELIQDNNIGYCRDIVSFSDPDSTKDSEKFGLAALLSVALMILGLVLMFAGDGPLSLMAAVVGLLASWFLGLFSFDWITVSAIIAFVAIIGWIGRYGRK